MRIRTLAHCIGCRGRYSDFAGDRARLGVVLPYRRPAGAARRIRARAAAGLRVGAGVLELERPPARLGEWPLPARPSRPAVGGRPLGPSERPLVASARSLVVLTR
jgi:hypothetical protein